MRYRLLAIDIDGTLVNSRDELTVRTRVALQRALDAGLRIVLATGRRYSRALPLVETLGLDVPLVTASGALIKHPLDHRTIYRATFERELLRECLAIVERAGYEAVLYGDSFGQGFDFYCPRIEVEHPELADYLALNPGCHRLWPRLMSDPPEGVFAGFAIGRRDEMLALHAELQRRLPGLLYTHVLRSPRYIGHMCEIAPFGVTKWSGIQQVAADWNIDPAEMCAVGDDVNDIPMIEAAGLGVAMGNARPEVKAAADRIAPSHDEDGLVEVVEWLLHES
ncbi:MAG TPA: Cof-type HAD-IIB family hydrolase [Pirellulales bacterium]|nr:Cof-type HAD-IIB family hydrolase [Pirellulales bacterium]